MDNHFAYWAPCHIKLIKNYSPLLLSLQTVFPQFVSLTLPQAPVILGLNNAGMVAYVNIANVNVGSGGSICKTLINKLDFEIAVDQ